MAAGNILEIYVTETINDAFKASTYSESPTKAIHSSDICQLLTKKQLISNSIATKKKQEIWD